MPPTSPSLSPLRAPTPTPWLHALVANVQDAIVILDAEGRIVFESPSACQILGIPSDDVLGTFGLSRIHPEDREAVISSFRRTIEVPGAISRATYRFQRADGQWQHLEALAKNLLHDPELQGVLITFRDVSERVSALEAAERASRARDVFLYNVSQELSAPVDAILACATPPAGPVQADPSLMLEQIRQHGAHLLRLIRIATDLAGVRNGAFSLENAPVSLDTIVDEAVAAVRLTCPRHDVRFQLELRSDGCLILGDRQRLTEMLTDLLDGLCRSSRFSGWINIDSFRTHGGYVRLEVRRGGEEMSERHLQNVFERFDRVGMAGGSDGEHGLGIAIACRLIEVMGGAMGIESVPGNGTSLWLQLPEA